MTVLCLELVKTSWSHISTETRRKGNERNLREPGDFRDRDYLETVEGLFFTVVGNSHPDDRVLAYLKYFPSPQGKWKRHMQNFDRAIKFYDIPHLSETIKFISSRYPHYLYNDRLLHISFTAVPTENVRTHHLPEEKLRILGERSELDTLQRKTVNLAFALSKKSGVELERFGVTGSLLIDVHQLAFSDIDLTTYGKNHGLAVRRALLETFDSQDPHITRVKGEDTPTPARQSRLRLMNEDQLRLFYERKWNRGLFMGTPFSVNPVLEPSDPQERYGQYRYIPIDMVEVRASVTDASESIFVPAKYRVSDTRVTSGKQAEAIKEIVSYDRDYGDIAFEGEKILVRGKLERVEDTLTLSSHHRIVVGSLEGRGADYIKVDAQ